MPEISGYPRLRKRHPEIDFVANDEGFERLNKDYNLRSPKEIGYDDVDGGFTYKDEIFLGIFHNNVRGYNFPQEAFQSPWARITSQGLIYSISPELGIFLKLRRGVMKGRMYGKDSLDSASILLGMKKRNKKIEVSKLKKLLSSECCPFCPFQECTQCLTQLESKYINISLKDRPVFLNIIKELKVEIAPLCKHN